METPAPRSYRISVEGMRCGACEKLVEMHLSGVEGVASVTADAEAGAVTLTAGPAVDLAAIEAGIVAAGFTPAGGGVTLEPIDSAGIPEESTRDDSPGHAACTTAVCLAVSDDEPGDVAPTPAGSATGAAAVPGSAVIAVAGKATLGILGMTCSSCQAVIEKTLARLDGVSSAAVNLANETATVEFDPAALGVDELIAAVRGAGYDAMVRVETVEAGESAIDAQREAQQAHIAHEMRLLVLSAALSVPLLLMMFQPFMDATPTLIAFWLAKTVGGAWDPMATGKYLGFLLRPFR